PNSEVKPLSADDSVAVCHAKVGNRQALTTNPGHAFDRGFFLPVAPSAEIWMVLDAEKIRSFAWE
uniref:hypothetical protein n=1 Tax=Thiolapillus sp. TaxID=2017437 RepID=UPI003AF78FE1